MAQEYSGILLCMAAVLRSTEGRRLLSKKKRHFGTKAQCRDWSTVVETQLQWERWLKSPSMQRSHVKKLETKHRYILYLMKKVTKRSVGMGLKLQKYHGALHVAQDLLGFGVHLEVDTGHNESGHKKTKTAAKLTQRNESTFDEQVAIRLEEVEMIDLALLEYDGQFGSYFGKIRREKEVFSKKKSPAPLGGSVYCVEFDAHSDEYSLKLTTKAHDESQHKMETCLVEFFGGLQLLVKTYLKEIHLYSTHRREGQIFRGASRYRKKVWRDWALFDWGTDGHLPGKIWGFTNLQGLPASSRLQYGGINLRPGIYAIIENSYFVEDEEEKELSEIFVPILKEKEDINEEGVTKFKFYLADVESILQPLTVIPDLEGKPNAYFLMKDRGTWVEDFERFLERPINLQEEISSNDDSSDSSE